MASAARPQARQLAGLSARSLARPLVRRRRKAPAHVPGGRQHERPAAPDGICKKAFCERAPEAAPNRAPLVLLQSLSLAFFLPRAQLQALCKQLAAIEFRPAGELNKAAGERVCGSLALSLPPGDELSVALPATVARSFVQTRN